MPRNGHSGRCFRDRRRTYARKERQGVITDQRKFAELAVSAGFFKTISSALWYAPRFDTDFFRWIVKQAPGIVRKLDGKLGVLHPKNKFTAAPAKNPVAG